MNITKKILKTLILSYALLTALLINTATADSKSSVKLDKKDPPVVSLDKVKAYRTWIRESGPTDWQIEHRNNIDNILNVGSTRR